MDADIVNLVVSNLCTGLCTGSASWLFKLKSMRKEAAAQAMEKVQGVYERLINDMQQRDEETKKEMQQLKSEVGDLRKEVARNGIVIKKLLPKVCALAPKCVDWVDFELPEAK